MLVSENKFFKDNKITRARRASKSARVNYTRVTALHSSYMRTRNFFHVRY